VLEGGKGTNYVPRSPPIAKSILEKERERNIKSVVSLEEPSLATTLKCIKSVVSLEEPSLATTTHFKIEGACAF
jgi:hypothetical protein